MKALEEKRSVTISLEEVISDLPTGEAGVGGGLAGPGLEAVGGRL